MPGDTLKKNKLGLIANISDESVSSAMLRTMRILHWSSAAVRQRRMQHSAASPPIVSLAWVRENAHVLTLGLTVGGGVLYIINAVNSLQTQVEANAKLLDARTEANAKMLDSSLKASTEANAKLLDSTLEANAKLLDSSQEASSKLLDSTLKSIADSARIIAENESLKTLREYKVRSITPAAAVAARRVSFEFERELAATFYQLLLPRSPDRAIRRPMLWAASPAASLPSTECAARRIRRCT